MLCVCGMPRIYVYVFTSLGQVGMGLSEPTCYVLLSRWRQDILWIPNDIIVVDKILPSLVVLGCVIFFP